jgi:branched-chain amino acid transport system substrate-binding protein
LSRKRIPAFAVVVALGATALVLASGAVGKPGAKSATPLPSSSCGPIFYKGSGSPQFLIASDLPLQGAGRAQNIAMQKAIQYVLEKQFHFKAGKYTVGYQGCDDSTAQSGAWDPGKCTANGNAYATNQAVIGVLGTFNSGCAKLIVPLVNRAPNGPVAMLSVANTAVGLTHFAPWNDKGEPNIYYPTGKRNYARLAASDDYQGPAGAKLLRSEAFRLAQGKKFVPVNSVYVVHDNQTFGKGVANAFRIQAKKEGIKVLGFDPWDPKATSYEALGQRIAATNPDSVYLGGIVCNNGVKLLKDLRAALGPKPVFVGPDGWTPYSATAAAGSAAQGMFISYAGLPLEKLPPTGKAFISAFAKYLGLKGRELPPPYSVYQAQGAQIMLNAIAKSNGTRADVNAKMFATHVNKGIMGTFHFDRNGDIVPTKTISFDQIRGKTGVPVYEVVLKVGA